MRRVRSNNHLALIQRLTVRPDPMRIVPRAVPNVEAADPVRLRFAREVLDRLDGPVLRYSMRVQLHRIARRFGLPLFDANVIIAQVLHQLGAAEAAQTPPVTARFLPFVLGTLMFVTIQSWIVVAGWMMFG